MKAIKGTSISSGFANGRAFVHRPPVLEAVEPRRIEQDEIKTETRRFAEAVDRAVVEVSAVRQQVAVDVGDSEAMIFDAHIAMLSDPALKNNVEERLQQELICAEAALAKEMQAFARRLSASKSDYMKELALDVHDVGTRLLRHLCVSERKNPLADLPPDTVIVAHDLTPSDTIGMDRKNVSGIATERGGATSHAAILARSLGIPAVTELAGLLELVETGTIVLLNGSRGSLVIDPSDAQRRRFAARRREFDQTRELMRRMEERVCQLRNGTRIRLMANIYQDDDVELTHEHHLDGIGLYRTELIYLSASSPPSSVLQYRHYKRAGAGVGTLPVTIRTFDFAQDKHPAFLSADAESLLDLGGLRFALIQQRLFKTQLRAIIRAARECPNLRIMFPMVTGWWELKQAVELVKALSAEAQLDQIPAIGAMIETPAAVFALPEIIRLVDFISIGCNDLAQHTLALDRSASRQNISESSLHPALLRSIQQIVETAQRAECPVCICGEAASDPLMAAIFAGLGLRQLSVSPAQAPVVRYALRQISLADAKRAADCALHADPAAVMAELQAILPAEFRSILATEPGP